MNSDPVHMNMVRCTAGTLPAGPSPQDLDVYFQFSWMCVCSGVVESYGKSMWNFLENGQAIFLVIFFIAHNSQGFGTMKLLWEPLSNNLWQLTPTLWKDLSAL